MCVRVCQLTKYRLHRHVHVSLYVCMCIHVTMATRTNHVRVSHLSPSDEHQTAASPSCYHLSSPGTVAPWRNRASALDTSCFRGLVGGCCCWLVLGYLVGIYTWLVMADEWLRMLVDYLVLGRGLRWPTAKHPQ